MTKLTEVETALANAMSDTDKEIFGDAFELKDGVTLDSSGDRQLESMGEGLEGQHEADEGDEDSEDGDETETEEEGEESESEEDGKAPDKDAKTDPKPADKVETKPDPTKPEGRVPPGVHRQATERARTAEAERDALKSQLETRDATHKREMDELKGQFNGLMTMLQRLQPQQSQPAKEQPKAAERPDLFENPDGFVDEKLSPINKAMQDLRVEMSMGLAHAMHKDVFEKAFDAINKLDPRNPDDQATVRRIYSAPNPGEALVNWHKRAETLRVVGDDPAAYNERIKAETRQALMQDPEFRKELIASLRAEASGENGGKPNNVIRAPKSLNGASGTGTARDIVAAAGDGSEMGIFNSAFNG